MVRENRGPAWNQPQSSSSRSARILVAGLCRHPSGCIWCLWFCCPAKEAQNRKHDRKWNTCLVYILSQRRNGRGWGSWGCLISKTEHWLNFPFNIQSCKKSFIDVMSRAFPALFPALFIVQMRCIVFPGVGEIPPMSNGNWFIFFGKNVNFSLPLVFFLHMKYVFSALNRLTKITDWWNQGFQNPVLEGLNPAGFSILPLALVKAVFWLDRKPSWFAALGDWIPTTLD